jgi:hypothetical protein
MLAKFSKKPKKKIAKSKKQLTLMMSYVTQDGGIQHILLKGLKIILKSSFVETRKCRN